MLFESVLRSSTPVCTVRQSSCMSCCVTSNLKIRFVCFAVAEEGILRDTDRTEQAIANVDAPGIVSNTSNIARRAHRILQVAQSEADNSEDPQFVDHVNNAVDRLRGSTFKGFLY